MTHAPCTTLPSWPHAYPASGARATLKALNEDFIVTELPRQLPGGEGEHIWLDIEKNGANTAFVDEFCARLVAQGLNPLPIAVASAPLNVKATAKSGTATASWAKPASNGGSAVTGYVARA